MHKVQMIIATMLASQAQPAMSQNDSNKAYWNAYHKAQRLADLRASTESDRLYHQFRGPIDRSSIWQSSLLKQCNNDFLFFVPNDVYESEGLNRRVMIQYHRSDGENLTFKAPIGLSDHDVINNMSHMSRAEILNAGYDASITFFSKVEFIYPQKSTSILERDIYFDAQNNSYSFGEWADVGYGIKYPVDTKYSINKYANGSYSVDFEIFGKKYIHQSGESDGDSTWNSVKFSDVSSYVSGKIGINIEDNFKCPT